MPNGSVHTTANLSALAGIYVVGSFAGIDATNFIIGGALGTFFVTPDLDLSGKVRTNAEKNWKMLGGLWYPLGALVKHRGITHTFLRGPLLLLLYFGALMAVSYFALLWILETAGIEWKPAVPDITWSNTSGVIAGYIFAYWLHLWMDGYSLKNRKRW